MNAVTLGDGMHEIKAPAELGGFFHGQQLLRHCHNASSLT